ncbi:MAG: outer membrane protein [Gaiellales bacterium]
MKRPTRLWVATLIAVAWLVLGGRPSSAEWFADIYAGASFTDSQDVKVHDRVVGRGTYRDVDFSTSLAYGGRFGRYFDAVPFLGVAVDYFNFSPKVASQSVAGDGCFLGAGCGSGQVRTGRIDISSMALSADLMLRLPLFRTAEEPRGVLQPYIGVGAPIFITTVTPRSTAQFRNHDGETDISFGYKAAGGVAVWLSKNLGLFGEYRFTHTTTDVDLHDAVLRRASFRTDLDTHSFLTGIAVRW